MSPTDLALTLLVVVIWGFNFVVVKVGLATLPPLLFSALRFLFAALPLVFIVGRPQVPWRLLVGYGLLQFTTQYAMLFCGMQLGVPAGLASLAIQLQAFLTIGLAVAFLGERPRAIQVMGALVCLAGIVVVGVNIESRSTLIGLGMILIGALAWACANLLTKKMGAIDPIALVGWGSLIATPPLLALSWAIEGPQAIARALVAMDVKSWLSVLFQSYPNTIFGFAVWSMLVRRYPSATVAPFSLLIPVVGIISGWLVLGEPMTAWKIYAGILVIVGLALNLLGSRRTEVPRSVLHP